MSEERVPTKNSQIFIARLHPKVTEKDLKYKFSKYGDIKDIRLKPGYAFIDYEKSEDAEVAIEKMDGREMHDQKIVVQISKRIYKDRSSRNNGERSGHRGREDRDGSLSRKRGPQPNDSCFNCGKSGHWANECRDPIKPRRDTRERDDLRCYKCGEKGHKQKFCPENRGRRTSSDSRGRNYRRDRSRSSSRSGRSRSSSRDRSRRHKRRSPSRSRSSSSYSSRSPRRDNRDTRDNKNSKNDEK